MAKGKEFRRPKAKSKGRYLVQDEGTLLSRNNDSLQPVFSFYHMREGDAHCITSCEHAVISSVTDTLMRISQLPWGRIAFQPKDGLGYEKLHRDDFTIALPKVVTPEVPILVFRHSDGGRIAGYREQDIYHILAVGQDLYTH